MVLVHDCRQTVAEDGTAVNRLVCLDWLEGKHKVELTLLQSIHQLLHRSNLVSVLSESTTILEKGMRAIPIDAADNEMDGCIHILKDAYMKNSAQEFIRMLSQSTSILANFALKDILR